ncbi:MAG: zinc-binding dehydrogenase [Chloroflexi bacterium]|nr:zinc-binding dehydrogenase [Chloroflexota bacterium]
MPTMRAALIREHGGPQVLELADVERPSPGPGEILVRVGACALNHLDIFVRRGMPGVRFSLPHVSGGDIAGWVEAAGDEGSARLVGATILLDPLVNHQALGEGPWGGLADYVVAPAENAIPLEEPDADLNRYAALPIAYGTAYRMLFTRARLQPGETVAVLGASGGVGVACVQFAHRIGARVIACSSSDEKLARLRALGAAETINTAREDVSRRVWELTGKQGADVVVDYNGRETWPGSIRCTRRQGRLVTCGATTGFEATTDLRYVWTRELTILGSDGWTRGDLRAIVDLVRRGELEPAIHAVFLLSRIREAEAEIEERRTFGKVIVIPDGVWNGRS